LLAAAAHAWRLDLDPDDVLARYGGEEFGLLLPGVSLADALNKLERLRHAMPLDQTVSIGAAEVLPGEDAIDTLRRADSAVYQAKAAGRNCVRMDQ
jgi:diguanylate cyclase (GGDEF)-like protein